jgi:ATP-dependent protease ClpP protease subunit
MNKKQGVFLNEIKAESTEASIDIVGVIGWEVAFAELKQMFAAIPAMVSRVVFNIYSPGGDVWDGNGIVQAIGELGKTRETVARVQVAASMATLIAVACKTRSIAANGRFLIHNPWTMVQGDGLELEKRAKELRACEAEMSAFYASRTGKTAEEMLALMNEERWLMPDETKSFGFVDSIDDPFKPEEVEDVRAEIVAAGKWPQALVEIPKSEEPEVKTEEKQNDANTTGGEGEGETKPGEPIKPEQPASDPAIEQAYEKGRVTGRSEASEQSMKDIESLESPFKDKIKRLEALVSKYQGLSDSLTAKLSSMEKIHADQIRVLTENLNAATARARKFLDGAMSFSPSPETWEDAMKSCGGDYSKAAKLYPELKKAFNDRKKK